MGSHCYDIFYCVRLILGPPLLTSPNHGKCGGKNLANGENLIKDKVMHYLFLISLYYMVIKLAYPSLT